VVHQEDLFRRRYLAAADQPDSRDGVVRRPEGAGARPRGTSKAGDEVAEGGRVDRSQGCVPQDDSPMGYRSLRLQQYSIHMDSISYYQKTASFVLMTFKQFIDVQWRTETWLATWGEV
jgi:hypothetical protein